MNSFFAIRSDSALPALDDWGRPEDAGDRTLEGDVRISGKIILGNFGDPVTAGFYAATRGRFVMSYPYHEAATVIEGEVTLIREDGTAERFGPGEGWVVEKGSVIEWTVHSDSMVKGWMVSSTDNPRP